MSYPTSFSKELRPVESYHMDNPGAQSLDSLAEAGFIVAQGVRRRDVRAITAIANQAGVREYCPNDVAKRFADAQMMEKWLTKGGGRGFFQLLSATGRAGYGWTGAETCAELPDSTTTFAIRLNGEGSYTGLGLARHFANVIVDGSVTYFDAKNIGLETWQSNIAAVKSYERAGAELVTTREDARPTLELESDFVSLDGEPYVRDTRNFMQFTRTFEA